jgi:AraC family transcriptional regulator
MLTESKLFIKGMVCNRCIHVIQSELQNLGVQTAKVTLGEVTVIKSNTLPDHQTIVERLNSLGFELVEDKKIKLVRDVKKIIEEVYSGNYDFPQGFRLSDLLVSKINKDYNTISAFFSLIEQKTIETFFIEYRIEKVKEFLVYSSLSLSDIAFKLNFSSVAHLSRQFKQYTGLTTSHFRNIKEAKLNIEFSKN